MKYKIRYHHSHHDEPLQSQRFDSTWPNEFKLTNSNIDNNSERKNNSKFLEWNQLNADSEKCLMQFSSNPMKESALKCIKLQKLFIVNDNQNKKNLNNSNKIEQFAKKNWWHCSAFFFLLIYFKLSELYPKWNGNVLFAELKVLIETRI